jgi:hypothetical protein
MVLCDAEELAHELGALAEVLLHAGRGIGRECVSCQVASMAEGPGLVGGSMASRYHF